MDCKDKAFGLRQLGNNVEMYSDFYTSATSATFYMFTMVVIMKVMKMKP